MGLAPTFARGVKPDPGAFDGDTDFTPKRDTDFFDPESNTDFDPESDAVELPLPLLPSEDDDREEPPLLRRSRVPSSASRVASDFVASDFPPSMLSLDISRSTPQEESPLPASSLPPSDPFLAAVSAGHKDGDDVSDNDNDFSPSPVGGDGACVRALLSACFKEFHGRNIGQPM